MATTKTTKKSGTRKKTNSTSYKSSTKRYKNTTLYRTTATKRRKLSTGTRESTMTVHYRSVPNHPKKPKTASKPKTTTTKKATAKTSKPKASAKPQAKTATASSRPTVDGRPMTDRELEFYKLGRKEPSKIKLTQQGYVPLKGTSDSELHAYKMGQREVREAERRFVDSLGRPGPTLAGKTIGAPVNGTENKYSVKASFVRSVDEKLSGVEEMSVYNLRIYAVTRETEKAAVCTIETVSIGSGKKQRRQVWIPKSCIEVH